VASTTKSTASASSTATSACSALLDATGVDLPATGVDERELPAGPVGVVGHPVPGHAGHVLDDRLTAPQDPVHQRGLADVGPSHDGDHGTRRLGLGGELGTVLGVDEGEVLLGELELLQPGTQRGLELDLVVRPFRGGHARPPASTAA
jgi:hypothetical protein